MEIQAGALCQLIRVWPRENFSAIDVRCLPSADSQVSHTLHQASSRERIPRLSPVRVSGCPGVRVSRQDFSSMHVWHLAGSLLEQVCRQSNGPSLEPRGFGKPSPTYPAPPSPHCSNISNAVLTIRLMVRTIFKNGSEKNQGVF